MTDTFKAFRIFNDGGTVHGTIVDTSLADLTAGEVVIKAAYSSVNYKDAMAATGGKIIRRFPVIGGIDVAGTVVSSADDRFRAGDRVVVTGYDLGVANDGGYAGYVRVPADWVVRLPEGLTPFEAMVYGTGGFTAALSVMRLETNGLSPGNGPVAVTGATGGVGSVAVAVLARLGYQVTAITRKDAEHDYLRALGAQDVLSGAEVVMSDRPLERAKWSAAVDPVGGDTLAWLTKTTSPWGSIANSGLTGGVDLRLTVIPFILRGVSILGIDSVTCPMPLRRDVWRRLATDMKPPNLADIGREIGLGGLPDAFDTLLAGKARGRFVVNVDA